MPESNEKTSLLKRLGPAGLLGILWACVPGIAGFYLLAKLGTVSEWLHDQGTIGLGVYIGVFILTAGLGLLPTYAQAVVGGWVFGCALGIPAALVGFTGASILGYAVARLVSRDRVEEVIEENPKAQAIRAALVGRGFLRTLGIITLLRVPPNSPFAITNLVLASSGVRLTAYIPATLIGMAPRTAVAVFFASSAASTGATDIQAFVKEGLGLGVLLAGVFIMLAVLGIIGTIANKAIERVVVGNAAAAPEGSD